MNKKHIDLAISLTIPVAVGALVIFSFRAIDRALERVVNQAFDWPTDRE